MSQKFKQIQISNLDNRFKTLSFAPKPKVGWIKTIRQALSMPLAFPANKLGISKQGVAQLEKNESEDTITLKSLRQLAEAMGCELHYAIIPHERSLKKLIEKRATEKATGIVNDVNKTMALEDQEIKDDITSIKRLTKDLAENVNFKLWSSDENN
ncbi:MAG: helix-turn-helix domain-containing protein [Rickettsiales bacterium]|jgi:predicted DNA-binding mobile mystery protein A|nr:helix-turn-helix domain-containing protein [Rickettsiales bacterium]